MLSRLRISGFRGINHFEIKGLKRINIFVGRNNHGKSSILEALYLASAAFQFRHPFTPRLQDREQNKIEYLLNRRSRRGLSWRRGEREVLWFGYDSSKPLSIEVASTRPRGLEIELFDWHPHPLVEIHDSPRVSKFIAKEFGLESPDFPHFCPYESSIISLHGNTSRPMSESQSSDLMHMLNPDTRRIKTQMEKMMFIDGNLLRDMESVEETLVGDLLHKRRDKLVTEILREGYEIDAEGLTYVPIGRRTQLAVKLPKTTVRIDDLGDGARCTLVWIMVAALAHDTAILIEEPENHQHPGGLAKTLEMLLKILKSNNIQLFATTHSIEFIKLIGRIAEERKVSIATFFIEMDKNGIIEPRSINPEDSKNLEKMSLDMRFLDVI